MSQELEILVLEFGEVNDLNWSRVEIETVRRYNERLHAYPAGPVNGSVTIRNIGRGADWLVVVLILGGLFFTIPETHKKIRESLEEWQHIFKEFKSLVSWLVGKKAVIYPDQYLFMVALFSVVELVNLDTLVFLGFVRLPEDHPDLVDKSTLLFTFAHDDMIKQVAVNRSGQVLWENQFPNPTTGSKNS